LEHFVLLIYPELCFIASFKNVAMLIIRSLSVFGEKLSVSNPSFFRSIGKSDTDHFYRCFELTDRLLTVFLWLITLPIINFFKRVWRECEHVIFSDAPIRRPSVFKIYAAHASESDRLVDAGDAGKRRLASRHRPSVKAIYRCEGII
jgi:hypothetical protein